MNNFSYQSSAALNVMVMAVQKAARGLVRDFGELEKLQTSTKSFGNFVTSADKRSEKILIDYLSKARPGYDILSEESGSLYSGLSKFDKDAGYRWIIDPLDGTTNFLHGIPYFAISIALEHLGNIIAGVVYNPITDEMYTAEKGGGAFFNRQRMRVSGRRAPQFSTIAHGSKFGFRDLDIDYSKLKELLKNFGSLRHFGASSLDLAFVAAGKFDGYFEARCNLWDIAAGIILVKEAGGVVQNFPNASPNDYSQGIIASNCHLGETMEKILQKIL